MQNLNKQNKIVVGVLIAILVGVIYYMALLKPTLNNISDTNNQISSAKTKLNDLNKQLDDNKKAVDECKKKDAEYSNALKRIPIQLRDPEISSNVKKIATNLTFTKLSVGVPAVIDSSLVADIKNITIPTKNDKTKTDKTTNTKTNKDTSKVLNNDIVETKVQLTVTGSYDDIIAYTEKLEKDSRVGFVTSYNMKVLEGKDKAGAIQCDISLMYFFTKNTVGDNKTTYDSSLIDTSTVNDKTGLFGK